MSRSRGQSGRRPGERANPRAAPGQVRIIGGSWRGTRLPVADVAGLRPTSDRARETLFNWLQPAIAGARVLDLFAGTGALGLEAVSRGAREALLVERDARVVEALHAVVDRLKARDAVRLVRADATVWLAAPLHGRFDIVFVDPPFADALWQPALAALSPWVSDDAWLYVESPSDGDVEPGADWCEYRRGGSRDARHVLYRRRRRHAATLAQAPIDDPSSLP